MRRPCSAAGAVTSTAGAGSTTRSGAGAGSGFGVACGLGDGRLRAAAATTGSGFGSTTGAGAAAFLAAAFLATSGAAPSPLVPASVSVSVGAAALAVAFFAAVFLTGFGSSGCSGRVDPITNGATFQPIGLRFDERAGVGLHTHTHLFTQRHHFGVGHSELLSELVHSHVLRQNQFSLSLASACRSVFRRPLILSCS